MEVGAGVDHVEAGHVAHPLGGIPGVGHAALSHLAQAVGTHGGQVDGGGHGAQGLVGAHVGGGLLPANVLLPGLEGENVGPAAVVVGGLAHDAAGQLPGEGGGGRHEAQVGTAEAQRHAQGLSLAHGDVGTALPRRLENSHGDGVDPHDKFGTGSVGGLP